MDCIQQLFLLAYIIASTLLKGLLANKDIGVNFLLPIWSMANVAQGGATLAVYFKTKTKTKEIAIPAAASAFLGITEPAILVLI